MYKIPDALFPTDNEFGIPQLHLGYQAEFAELPVRGWGNVARKDRMRGTWHFYVDDDKFSAIWKKPDTLLKTRAVGTVEVNFSTDDQMPLAIGLYRIYQKRWLSRYWQEYGVPVWVDLNVADKYQDLNLFGVPKGWNSFATYGQDTRLEDLDKHYAVACGIGSDVRFLVYGGSKGVAEWCASHNAVHIMDTRLAKRTGANG